MKKGWDIVAWLGYICHRWSHRLGGCVRTRSWWRLRWRDYFLPFFCCRLIIDHYRSTAKKKDEICANNHIIGFWAVKPIAAVEELVWSRSPGILITTGDTVVVMLQVGRLCTCTCVQICWRTYWCIFVYNVHICVYKFVPMVSQDVYLGGKIRKFIFL